MKNKFRKGMAVGFFCLLMLVSVPIINGDWIEYPKEEGPYYVFMGGNSQSCGIIEPFMFDFRGFFKDGKSKWLQIGPLSLNVFPYGPEYDMEKGSIFFVNGKFQNIEYPVLVWFRGFKGYAPATIIWVLSAFFGRIRIFGVCDEIYLLY